MLLVTMHDVEAFVDDAGTRVPGIAAAVANVPCRNLHELSPWDCFQHFPRLPVISIFFGWSEI
jgi:hypothetical protein